MPQDTQDTTIPKLVTDVTTDHQLVDGPDGKQYRFNKNISPDRINKYFIKKGWVLKGDKWFTANGEPVDKLKKLDTNPQPGVAELKRKQNLDKVGSLQTDIAVGAVASTPTVFGIAGAMLRGVPGAAAGGALGRAVKDYTGNYLYDKKVSPKQYATDVTEEAFKQAVMEKGGQKLGDIFFAQLNKMPHAIEKDGIPLMPGDLKDGSKLIKYIEDLLSNLAPSAKNISKFKETQNEAIVNKATTLVNGLAKFKGTSEQLGILVRKTLATAETQELKALKAAYPNIKTSTKLFGTKEGKIFVENFKNSLSQAIIKTDKPELIAGFIRGTSAGSLEDTRIVTKLIHELNPETLGKVQHTILRDITNEAAFGSVDPVSKSIGRGTGPKITNLLNAVGEQKLRTIFGAKTYDNIKEFSDLIQHIDKTQGNGTGKFLNLVFILPFRSGLSLKGASKVAATGLLANRVSKIITSTEGMKIYEGYIRATAINAPKLINGFRDEIVAFNEKADREYELEKEVAEDEYKKSLPTVQSNAPGTEAYRAEQFN